MVTGWLSLVTYESADYNGNQLTIIEEAAVFVYFSYPVSKWPGEGPGSTPQTYMGLEVNLKFLRYRAECTHCLTTC